MSSKMTSTRRLTIISMLSTLSFVGRTAFGFLPNVQPTTTIIVIITLYMGVREGLLVAIISILMSNIYMGMGVWTIAQILSYSIIVIFIKMSSKIHNGDLFMAIVSLFAGLLYGLTISLVQAPFFGWVSFFPYYLSGIPYDIFHGAGNFMFYIILNPILNPLFERYTCKKDVKISYLEN